LPSWGQPADRLLTKNDHAGGCSVVARMSRYGPVAAGTNRHQIRGSRLLICGRDDAGRRPSSHPSPVNLRDFTAAALVTQRAGQRTPGVYVPARERQFSICGAAAAPQRGRTGPATATAQAPGRPRSRPSPRGIGLDQCRIGISTNSARGPETTGNNWYQSDNADTRAGHPTLEPGSPPSVPSAGKTAAQASGRGAR
jgi:hypothetical protein